MEQKGNTSMKLDYTPRPIGRGRGEGLFCVFVSLCSKKDNKGGPVGPAFIVFVWMVYRLVFPARVS